MRQNSDDDSTVKEVKQTEEFAAAVKMKDDGTNATAHDTIMHERVKNYGQTEVGKTYVNGNKVATVFDSCSSMTVIKHNIIAESDVIEINIRDIED